MGIETRRVQGFKCLECFDNIYVDYVNYTSWNDTVSRDSVKRTNDECNCGNCALILDTDGIQHLYCDDIKTVMHVELDIEDHVVQGFDIKGLAKGFYFYNIRPLMDTGWSFKDNVNQLKSSKVRQAFMKKNKRKGLK